MATYLVKDANGTVVNTVLVDDLSTWTPPEGCTAEWVTDGPAAPRAPLSQLDFLRRFTVQERVLIRKSQDDPIKDFMHLLSAATYVHVDDEDTMAGVAYLVQKGLLTAERGAQILT